MSTIKDIYSQLNDVFHFTSHPFTTRPFDLNERWEGRVFSVIPTNLPEWPCRPDCDRATCRKRGYHNETYLPGTVDWMEKAYSAFLEGALVVALVQVVSLEAEWWQVFAGAAHAWLFLKGRLRYSNTGSYLPGASAIVVYGNGWHRIRELSHLGLLVPLPKYGVPG